MNLTEKGLNKRKLMHKHKKLHALTGGNISKLIFAQKDRPMR
jgi:hypothetical protein